MFKKTIYALYHIYDRYIDGVLDQQWKRIGFFESREECIRQIKRYRKYEGFRDYPITCFKIFEYEIGKEYWRKEFCGTDQVNSDR